MTTEEVVQQLAPWREAHRRSAWKPLIDRGDGELIDHKFSGTPWLAKGEEWPTCSGCKKPLQLFLQLNLSELPQEMAGRFGDGLLQLFYCTRDEECVASQNASQPFEGGKCVRVVTPDRRMRGVKIPIAEGYFPALTIEAWKRVDDYPSSREHEDLGLKYDYDFSANTARIEWPAKGLVFDGVDIEIAEAISDALEGDKLGGWPKWIQGAEYPNCPRCQRRMEFIFQLDSEDHLPYMFGDVGCGHVTQCPIHKDVVTFAWACS